MYETEIPEEFPGHISHGEFGKGITTLYLQYTYCTLVTVTSMILSLPDLKRLCVEECQDIEEEPLPAYSVAPQRGPLDSLELLGYVGGVGETLAKFRFISSRLSLDADITSVEQLLICSSETVIELQFHGV
jgi:hypothetical protein